MNSLREYMKWAWPALVLFVLLMLPVLAMPLGQDQATFLRGGRAILAGDALYIDFIDVKPPLIYALFGIAEVLCGSSEVSLRVFDILFQTLCVGLLLQVMHRVGGTRLWHICTTVIYAMIYANAGYSQCMQAETFFALPLILCLYACTMRAGWRRDVLIGLCTGAAFFLKYTLAIMAPVALGFLWATDRSLRATLVSTARAFGAFLVFAALMVAAFYAHHGMVQQLAEVIAYLRVYSSHPAITFAFLTFTLHSVGDYFGDILSLLVTCVAAAGIACVAAQRTPERVRHLFALALWLMAALLLTVVMERKFSPYHFSRVFIPLAMFAGYGLSIGVRALAGNWHTLTLQVRLGLSAVMLLGVAVSPLARYFNVAQLAVRSIGNRAVYDTYLTRPDVEGFDFTAIRTLERDLHHRLTASDKAVIVTMMATPILPWLPTQNLTPFADSHFYLGVGARPVWRERIREDIRQADWVVVDTVDKCPGMTLHDYSSWGSLRRDTMLLPALNATFDRVDTVATFFIYKRKQS